MFFWYWKWAESIHEPKSKRLKAPKKVSHFGAFWYIKCLKFEMEEHKTLKFHWIQEWKLKTTNGRAPPLSGHLQYYSVVWIIQRTEEVLTQNLEFQTIINNLIACLTRCFNLTFWINLIYFPTVPVTRSNSLRP